jgi:hypothetical protein
MMMRTNEFPNDAPRVKFEQPLEVRVMTIDGTWCAQSFLIDVSETNAQIEVTGHAAELTEFFLLLTSFGNPVFRRCKREWVHGARLGVSFNKTNIGLKSLEEVRHEAELVP